MPVKREVGFTMIKPAEMHVHEPVVTEFDISDHLTIGFGKRVRYIKRKEQPRFLIKK
jgi:hypothetical protein